MISPRKLWYLRAFGVINLVLVVAAAAGAEARSLLFNRQASVTLGAVPAAGRGLGAARHYLARPVTMPRWAVVAAATPAVLALGYLSWRAGALLLRRRRSFAGQETIAGIAWRWRHADGKFVELTPYCANPECGEQLSHRTRRILLPDGVHAATTLRCRDAFCDCERTFRGNYKEVVAEARSQIERKLSATEPQPFGLGDPTPAVVPGVGTAFTKPAGQNRGRTPEFPPEIGPVRGSAPSSPDWVPGSRTFVRLGSP